MKEKIIPKKNHYRDKSYLGTNAGRLSSYRMQIYLTLKSNPCNILLVGKGDGIVDFILETNQFNIVTCDIEPDLGSEIIGDVLDLPIEDKKFDTCICCEVLEHLPFKKFPLALAELKRVTRNYLILSVPDIRRFFSFRMKVFDKLNINWQLSLSKLHPVEMPSSAEHYWEIGYNQYSLKNIKENISKTGWDIIKIYRVYDFPYHTFFYCKT